MAERAETRAVVFAMEWDSVIVGGGFFTGVVRVSDCSGGSACCGWTLQRGEKVRVFLQDEVQWADVSKITVVNFLVQEDEEGWRLIQTHQGRLFVHAPFRAKALLNVKEACCGIGALGRGLAFLGYSIVAQNDIQGVTVGEAARLSGAARVQGDISCVRTVVDLWDTQPGDCTLAAGVACQPYSRLGDRRTFRDERAETLPGTLRAGYLMQCSCVILECVPQVLDDPWVQQILQEYSSVTGQVISQTVLSLHKVWTARRDRWWCVLATPDIAPPTLVTWKPHGPWHSVSDVIDCFNVSTGEEVALSLSPYEKETFESLRPISLYCIQMNQPLPTALHSWGSPLTACPCGCRSGPFKIERLQRSGICSVLVPFQQDDGSQHFRFPSAAETALLCGLTPCLQYGEPRLSLALVGQLASPLQAAWIGVQVASRLNALGVGFPSSLDGIQVLHTQRRMLLHDAEVMGYRPFTGQGLLSHCPSIGYQTHAQIIRDHCEGLRKKDGKDRISPAASPSGLDLAPSLPVSSPVLRVDRGVDLNPPVTQCNAGNGADVAGKHVTSLAAACRPSYHHESAGSSRLPLAPPSGLDLPASVGVDVVGSPLPLGGLVLNPVEVNEVAAAPRAEDAQSTLMPHAKRARLHAPCDAGPGPGLSAPEGPSFSVVHGAHRQTTYACPPTVGITTCDGRPFGTLQTAAANEPDEDPGHALPPPIRGILPGWAHFVARSRRSILQCVLEDFTQVPGFLVVDAKGTVVPPSAWTEIGQSYWLWVPNGAQRPDRLQPPKQTLAQCWPRSSTCLTTSQRRHGLQLQGTCLADDQVSSSLAFIAGCGRNVSPPAQVPCRWIC